ncbi:MAG: ABC transporter ATP-binding protein [Pseudomonadota bacterium]
MDTTSVDHKPSQEVGNLPLVKRLFRENFADFAPRYVIAIVFMVISAAATALTAWIMKDIVESLFMEGDFDRTLMVGLFVILLFAIKGAATYGQLAYLARVGNAIVARLQMRMFDQILAQSGSFYARYPSNDLITRIGQNAQGARQVIDLVVTSICRDALTLIGLIIVMVLQDPLLSLIAFITAPPVIFAVSQLVRRVRKAAKQQFDSNTQIIRVMQDSVRGSAIVKSFRMEEVMRARMGDAVRSVESRNNRIASLTARASPLMDTLGGLCMGIVIIYAGWMTSVSDRTPAEFMAFLTAFLLAYEPAKRIARLHIYLETGLVGARLMYEILDQSVVVEDRPDAAKLEVKSGEVEFRDVQFRYEPAMKESNIVLNALSFKARGGETTALVGPSGAGKSTIVNLIPRLYDVDEGQILIDGVDVRDVSMESLRDKIAFVSQDTFLIDGSIRQNITAGRDDVSDTDVIEAAKIANAHAFIEALDEGYDTIIGENGETLSGGQRQRIAIARAVLKDAPIVLLDEATSALDNESERLIQDALEKLATGRTNIVIAHRLTTIKNAECIHVIENGRIVESGTHEALLETGTVYRHLHEMQFRERKAAAE